MARTDLLYVHLDTLLRIQFEFFISGQRQQAKKEIDYVVQIDPLRISNFPSDYELNMKNSVGGGVY